jgi:transcription elongation GreA/GreB family factor
MNTADWLHLVRQAEWATLDDRWMAAVEDPSTDREPLLVVLETLAKGGEGQRAATLAWMWLTTLRERSTPREVIELAREMIVHSSGSDQLRGQVAELYKEVYADRPGIETLIEASGLLGGKSPRRALRTLEVALQAAPGSCLISRTDDRPAEVVEADLARSRFVLRTGQGNVELDADQLAANYNPADPNDFRVLSELHPERFATLLADDPAGLIIGLLRARGGRLDADDLKYTLTPRYLPAEEWSKWWSKARTALKRHPNVRLEGRLPVVLVYDEAGCSLEDEIKGQWSRARTAEERIAVVDSYMRETKSRKTAPHVDMLAAWAQSLAKKAESHRHHPAEAIRSALVVERLRQTGLVPAAGRSPVETLLAESKEPDKLLAEFATSDLMHLLIEPAKSALPDRWQDIFVQLLPSCPPDICDALAGQLLAVGARERLQEVIRQIPSQPLENLRAMAWLWRGPEQAEGLELPPRVELFGRMLTLLADLARKEDTPPETLKFARGVVRAALVVRKYAIFRETLTGLEPEMVQAIHRLVTRTPGLSGALVHDLRKIIHELYPTLFEKARLEPWEDPNVLYSTEKGRAKAEEELNHIVNVKMAENARAIGAAAAHGDLSENSEYKFALEERDLLRARAANIQNDLSRARVIEPYIVPRDFVGVGSKVKVRSTDGQVEREMVFLGPWDADIEHHIYNYNAPMSQRMMGLQVGETVELNLDGTNREYRIESISSAV